MDLKERFLHYVSFDTQSNEASDTFPSTDKQLVLLRALHDEMIALGLTEVSMDKYGYVMGSIPATKGMEDRPVVGFISHVDTAPDMSGANVKPQIIENYDGKDIRLNESLMMTVADFPELSFYKGHTLITTDGTTLLGADDKAGVAEIMTMAEYFMTNPQIAHGKIRIGFTPDEEIGRGVDHFDVKQFGAQFAYTVDGGFEGELEYENFNAASAKLSIQGRNIHPGSAKGKMLNALQIACDLHEMLPVGMRPELTEEYEGFFHLIHLSGSVESAEMAYIIRDHSRELFEKKKQIISAAVSYLNTKIGEEVISLTLKDQYYNMYDVIKDNMECVNVAKAAMEKAGITPICDPIRGGTDGSKISFMGIPTPNIFTGVENLHGRHEFACIDDMKKAVEVIVNIVNIEK